MATNTFSHRLFASAFEWRASSGMFHQRGLNLCNSSRTLSLPVCHTNNNISLQNERVTVSFHLYFLLVRSFLVLLYFPHTVLYLYKKEWQVNLEWCDLLMYWQQEYDIAGFKPGVFEGVAVWTRHGHGT